MDEAYNADLDEAVMVFLNATRNKRRLWQLELLPAPNDSMHSVLLKLREAFLSNATYPTCQLCPSDRQMRQYLLRRGRLKHLEAPRHDVYVAMQNLCRHHGLTPNMKTYNGLLTYLQASILPDDPKRRDAIKVGGK